MFLLSPIPFSFPMAFSSLKFVSSLISFASIRFLSFSISSFAPIVLSFFKKHTFQ